MTHDRHERADVARYSPKAAIKAEAEHLIDCFAHIVFDDDPDEAGSRTEARLMTRAHAFVAGLSGATVAAATRHMRAHPDETDPHCRKQAAFAEIVTARLPPRLGWLWRAHYLDGHPLDICALNAGKSLTVARFDYRDLLLKLAKLAKDLGNATKNAPAAPARPEEVLQGCER